MSRYPSSSFAPSRYQVEAEQSQDPARLDELSLRRSNFVHSAVAKNPHTSPATLARLAESENAWTRSAVAKNPHTPASTLADLCQDPDAKVRSAVAYNRCADAAMLDALAGDLNQAVRVGVAWNHATPPVALARLAQDETAPVRIRVAKNPHTPEAALLELAGDSSAEVRHQLTQRNFNPDAPTEQVTRRRFNGRHTVTQVQTRHVETGGRFSAEMVRAFANSNDVQMHFRAASQPDAPEDVLLHLAANSPADFTLTILAENKGASARVLRAVAERGESQSLKAVAAHPNTDEETRTMLALSQARSVHAVLASTAQGMQWLARHEDPKVRRVAATNLGQLVAPDPDLVVSLASELLHDADAAVQATAAKSMPRSMVDAQAGHTNQQVRKIVAERTVSSGLLDGLACDEKAVVRRAVARNQHASTQALALLGGDRDERTRLHAAERFLAALGN